MTFPANSVPGSSAQGVLSQIFIVTSTHGQKQVPIIQSFNFDPKFVTNSIGEFATNKDVLTTQSFKNVDISFEIFETDLPVLYNCIMDLDPNLATQTPFAVLPEQMYQVAFNMYGNQGHNFTGGYQFEGFVATQCRIVSITEAAPLDGNKKVSVKIIGNWGATTKAGGVYYARMVSTAPVYTATGDITFGASNHIAYLTKSAVAVPLPGTGGTTQQDLVSYKNGQQIYSTSGVPYKINYGNQFDVPGTIATTDVWETFVLYNGL